MQGQLEHTERVLVLDLQVRDRGATEMAVTARPDNKFAEAVAEIQLSSRILGRESLVVVDMPSKDNIGAVIIKGLPEGLSKGVASADTEPRFMPVREYVAALMRG